MTDVPPIVVNIESVTAIERLLGERWGAQFKPLTPSMRPRGGSLGVNLMLLPPGRTACPFHSHQREDEAFFVLKGRGVLRYGDQLIALRAGDCVSCPAGTGDAHQLANPYEDGDLVYLAIGTHDPHEVCVYPDSGKVLVRSLEQLGRLEAADYFEGEPRPPKIFEMMEGAPEREEGAPTALKMTQLSEILKRAEAAELGEVPQDEPIRSSMGLMRSLAQLGWIEDLAEPAGGGDRLEEQEAEPLSSEAQEESIQASVPEMSKMSKGERLQALLAGMPEGESLQASVPEMSKMSKGERLQALLAGMPEDEPLEASPPGMSEEERLRALLLGMRQEEERLQALLLGMRPEGEPLEAAAPEMREDGSLEASPPGMPEEEPLEASPPGMPEEEPMQTSPPEMPEEGSLEASPPGMREDGSLEASPPDRE